MRNKFTRFMLFILIFFRLLNANAQTIDDATRLSYQGKYNDAETIFAGLLSKNKTDTRVLVASGFNNAWNKKYKTAKERFTKALQSEPANIDAQKGMAYTYLYEASYAKSAKAFIALLRLQPNSAEYYLSLGLAYMNMEKKGKAAAAFTKVLALNSENRDAQKYLSQVKAEKGIVDIAVLSGLSSYDHENKFGLRQIIAGYHVNSAIYLYGRYDNSLSLDNYDFIRSGTNTSAISGGIYARWHQYIGSKFEYGYRSLPAGGNQMIYQTEQVIFLPWNFIAKIGGSLISTTQEPAERVLMTSLSVPLTKKLRLEPHYYLIDKSSDENRWLINASYRFSSSTDIALGVFNGVQKNKKTNNSNTIFGTYAYSNFHIAGPLSGVLLAKYEKDAFTRESITAAFGLKVTIDTKRF